MNGWLGVDIDDVEMCFLEDIIQDLIIPCAKEKRYPTNSDIMHKVLKLAMKEYYQKG